MLVAPRVAYRVLSRDNYNLQKMVGNTSTENVLGQITHYMLYGFMVIMPASGVVMGYYGGKGLPFFVTTIPGALAANNDDETKKRNGQIAKQVRTVLRTTVLLQVMVMGRAVECIGIHVHRYISHTDHRPSCFTSCYHRVSKSINSWVCTASFSSLHMLEPPLCTISVARPFLRESIHSELLGVKTVQCESRRLLCLFGYSI
jgi:hypothetical protein